MCSLALVLEKQSNTLTSTTQLNLQQQLFQEYQKNKFKNLIHFLIAYLPLILITATIELVDLFDSKRIVMEVRPNQTVDDSPQHRRHGPATPSKQPVAPSSKVDSTSVSQRLQKELMSLMMIGGDLGVSAFPEGESIFAWIGTIMGGKGTAYEGLSYKLSLCFPPEYPFKPPQVKFETMCFHPNVDQFGNICLDILQDKWSSAYDCRTILLSIQSLLGEPNPESPLNNYAARLWNNKEDYKSMVHRQYYAGEVFES